MTYRRPSKEPGLAMGPHLLLVLHEVLVAAVLGVAGSARAPQAQRHAHVHARDDAQWREVLHQEQHGAVTQHRVLRHVHVVAERLGVQPSFCKQNSEP